MEDNVCKVDNYYKYFCDCSKKANVLNKLLGYPYGRETDFEAEQSEGIFRFYEHQYKMVKAVIDNV